MMLNFWVLALCQSQWRRPYAQFPSFVKSLLLTSWWGGSIIELCESTVQAEKISSDREACLQGKITECKVRFLRFQWRSENCNGSIAVHRDCHIKATCFFSSYHPLSSAVIYYWTDALQHGIYLLNSHNNLRHFKLMSWILDIKRMKMPCKNHDSVS